MSEVTVTDLFYELTKDQMESLCPSDLRLIIRKAFDNKRSGMGPGPTMQEVIDHYNDERNYWVIRGVSEDSNIHDALDRLMARKQAGTTGTTPWTLPSIIDGSALFNPVGGFRLGFVRASSPTLDKILTDAGW